MNRFFAAVFVCLITSTTFWGQTPTSVVTGVVVDPTGGTVPEALVTVVNQDTNVLSHKLPAPMANSPSLISCPAITC